MRDSTEQDLIRRCNQGDMAAFEILVSRYEAKIFALAYRLAGNRQDGEDLAQEAFIRAWRALPNFRGDAALSTWLITITTNLWRDQQRKSKLPVDSLDENITLEDGEIQRQLADSRPGPEALCEEKEMQQQLAYLIGQLKPDFRVALVLRDVQGYTYEEVAAITQTSIGTVKSRISRGRIYLREKLAKLKEQNMMSSRLSNPKAIEAQRLKEKSAAPVVLKGGEV